MKKTNYKKEAKKVIELIGLLLDSAKNGYYSYLSFDLRNKYIKHWHNNGVIKIGFHKPKYSFMKDKRICHVADKDALMIGRQLLLTHYK